MRVGLVYRLERLEKRNGVSLHDQNEALGAAVVRSELSLQALSRRDRRMVEAALFEACDGPFPCWLRRWLDAMVTSDGTAAVPLPPEARAQ